MLATGQMEYVVDLSIKRCSGKDFSEGMSEAANVFDIKKRIKTLAKYFNTRVEDASARKELELIGKSIVAVFDLRNKVVHALYAQDETGRRVRIARISKKPFQGRDLGISIREYEKLRDDLRYWRYRLDNLTRAWFLGGPAKPPVD